MIFDGAASSPRMNGAAPPATLIAWREPQSDDPTCNPMRLCHLGTLLWVTFYSRFSLHCHPRIPHTCGKLCGRQGSVGRRPCSFSYLPALPTFWCTFNQQKNQGVSAYV